MSSDPQSVQVMSVIDRMSPGFRALVHEFGAVIVDKMMAEGYRDPAGLRPILETWRERRQDEWLRTDYMIPKKAFERAS
jgi:hypothetical protein